MKIPKYEVTYRLKDGSYAHEYYSMYPFAKGCIEFFKSEPEAELAVLKKRHWFWGTYDVVEIWRKDK